jgi:hypothetical protein
MDSDQFSLLYNTLQDTNTKLDAMHGDFREFKGNIEVRVTASEKQADTDRRWSRIQTIVVIPVIGAIHQLAAHLGLIR